MWTRLVRRATASGSRARRPSTACCRLPRFHSRRAVGWSVPPSSDSCSYFAPSVSSKRAGERDFVLREDMEQRFPGRTGIEAVPGAAVHGLGDGPIAASEDEVVPAGSGGVVHGVEVQCVAAVVADRFVPRGRVDERQNLQLIAIGRGAGPSAEHVGQAVAAGDGAVVRLGARRRRGSSREAAALLSRPSPRAATTEGRSSSRPETRTSGCASGRRRGHPMPAWSHRFAEACVKTR